MIKRIFKIFGVTLVAIISPVFSYWLFLVLTGNIHVVEEGLLIRSRQLSSSQIHEVTKEYGVRSIVNLRGANPDRQWYKDEKQASDQLGLVHVDFPMSANQFQEEKKLNQLFKIMDGLPTPILIHCQAGADRSGLVSALYVYVNMKKPASEAKEQLSTRFGHFPYLWSRTYRMGESFDNFVENRPQ